MRAQPLGTGEALLHYCKGSLDMLPCSAAACHKQCSKKPGVALDLRL